MTQSLTIADEPRKASQLSPIKDILEEVRNGRMIVLVDAEDRENEGDLVIPAQMANAAAINFMAKHGRGLVCLALEKQRVQQLGLELMSTSNESRHRTAFTVSIEAREGISTGISAQDRAHTISVAIDPAKGARDLVSPGHVFPLVARRGGVLVRAGHTEAAVDIARLAGLYPAGVICEIMNDDGTMARMDDLVVFARKQGLKIATIADLIAYRRSHDNLVELVTDRPMSSPFGGDFRLRLYRNVIDGSEHIALVKGEIARGEPALVRVHALNVMSDVLALDGQADSYLHKAMRYIGEAGRGVLVLICDNRPGNLSRRLSPVSTDAGSSQTESRLLEYGVGAQILLDLGVREMILVSNAPTKKIVGLEGYGLRVVGQRRLDD